jgi:hypothetical protein
MSTTSSDALKPAQTHAERRKAEYEAKRAADRQAQLERNAEIRAQWKGADQ